MREALIIGGSGTISSAVVKSAMKTDWHVTLLNRGSQPAPEGANHIIADIRDRNAVADAIAGKRYDSVCDFFTFTREQAEQNIALFSGIAKQYIFISSATVYQKPPLRPIIDEGTPRGNPYSQYARDKMASEDAFHAAYNKLGFPITVVRPNYTYGDSLLPWVPNSRAFRYSVIMRMASGKPIVVPGDGTSFFTLTHSSDFASGFVGLMGNTSAAGHDFHITSDNAMTWDGYLYAMADAVGLKPDICHIASQSICKLLPQEEAALLGDKSVTCLFDNRKIKAFVPGFNAVISFEEGIRQVLNWYHARPELMQLDAQWDAAMDRLVEAYS